MEGELEEPGPRAPASPTQHAPAQPGIWIPTVTLTSGEKEQIRTKREERLPSTFPKVQILQDLPITFLSSPPHHHSLCSERLKRMHSECLINLQGSHLSMRFGLSVRIRRPGFWLPTLPWMEYGYLGMSPALP